MKIVQAVSGIAIRLTAERLGHISTRHPEMVEQSDRILETVAFPDYVQKGDSGTLIAVRHYAKTPLTQKFCLVVYREIDQLDGFIVTAYFTSKPLEGREILWKR